MAKLKKMQQKELSEILNSYISDCFDRLDKITEPVDYYEQIQWDRLHENLQEMKDWIDES